MSLLKILRHGLIGTLIAAVPATASIAATRPGAAVPMAGSASTAATAAQSYDDGDEDWLWMVPIGIAVLIGLIFLLDDDDDDDAAASDG